MGFYPLNTLLEDDHCKMLFLPLETCDTLFLEKYSLKNVLVLNVIGHQLSLSQEFGTVASKS